MPQKIIDKEDDWELSEWVANAWARGGRPMAIDERLLNMQRGKKRHSGSIMAGRYKRRLFDIAK